MLIFRLAQPARRLIDKLQDKIEKIALNPFGNTELQYERILKLTDKRAAIINLLYLHRVLCEAIGAEEAAIMELYSRGSTGREIGEARGESAMQIFVRLRRAFTKGARALKKEGYDLARFEKEYCGLDEIRSAYLKMDGGQRKSKEIER
jgi:hypothetical protein